MKKFIIGGITYLLLEDELYCPVPQLVKPAAPVVPILPAKKVKADKKENGSMGNRFHFTPAQMEKIAKRLDQGEKATALAKEFGCTATTIYNIRIKVRQQKSGSEVTDDDEDETLPEENVRQISKPELYAYECNCGYSFKSKIPPQIVRCPDCGDRPRLAPA